MSFLKSAGFFLQGIFKHLYTIIPGVFFLAFDLAKKLFNMNYTLSGWFAWMLLGIGIFIAAIWSYHDLRKETEDVYITVKKLKKIKVVIKGQNSNMAKLLLILRQPLAYGVRERNLQEPLGQILTEPGINQALAELKLAGIITSQYIDPAPGSPTAERKSADELPYHFYSLTELGRRTLNKIDI